MIDEGELTVAAALAALFLMVSVLWFIFWSASDSKFKKEAIERGYALYCPTTGNFAWQGECDD